MPFSATLRKSYIWLDPRTKFVLLFFIGFYIFTGVSTPVEVLITCVLSGLMFLGGEGRTALKILLLYTVMVLLDSFVSPLIAGAWYSTLFYTIVRLVRYMVPIVAAALLLIRTTTVSEFIAAFRKMRLPDSFIIPVSVMFRFIPTVSEEWRSIRNAMRFRGIGGSFRSVLTKPMITLEYMLVPLLMSTATISDDLAAASLARGLESGVQRSCVKQVRFGWADYLLVVGCAGLFAHWVVKIFA